MLLQYNLNKTEQGVYQFTTDSGYLYTAFFTSYRLHDQENNTHTVYSFGFDRSGNFNNGKFQHEYDEKIKNTIIYIVKDFFLKNDNKALLYFCYSGDEHSRQRSILFSKWCRDEVSADIEHLRKTTIINNEVLYGGILLLKSNPLRDLLVNAISNFIEEIVNSK